MVAVPVADSIADHGNSHGSSSLGPLILMITLTIAVIMIERVRQNTAPISNFDRRLRRTTQRSVIGMIVTVKS